MNRPILFALFQACLVACPAASMTDRLRLTSEHVDLQVVVAPAGTNLFQLVVRDDDHGTNHQATNVVLTVPESAKLIVPDGFPELGDAGSPIWVLPAIQNPALLYLGISAEGLSPAVPAQKVDIFARRVDGPGHFVVWQFDGQGNLAASINTRDGLDETDRLTPLVGGHEHHNLGFSTNGCFTVWLQARATVDGTNAWSAETPFLFAVEPLPELSPFQQWQADQWPGVTDAAIIGPAADPDGDDRCNLLEYAHGLDPKSPDTTQPVFLTLQTPQGQLTGAFTYRRAKRATDLEFHPEVADTPAGPWTPLTLQDDLDDDGDAEWITLLDPQTVAQAPRRFFRLRVAFR